ncbi:hypothetical protein [Oxalicibacterium solurbis]|uniref:Uncharacterized protein n=1 Tax=Oxalicibacterium solurbis TaxID=69280 RepID=A0A8J3AXA5_9BURK|nr:hypothetical protein [Oxalicibacterium solurbis]GGI55045.1 hypothetical protein GCM10011430_22190 [Oxalicibacterium solurbis]
MTKLQTMFAGIALALFSQFAAAQSASSTPGVTVVPAEMAPPPGDPAYTDQSRANRTNDPYVKRRAEIREAKQQYRTEKSAAKEDYKASRKDANKELKNSMP